MSASTELAIAKPVLTRSASEMALSAPQRVERPVAKKKVEARKRELEAPEEKQAKEPKPDTNAVSMVQLVGEAKRWSGTW